MTCHALVMALVRAVAEAMRARVSSMSTIALSVSWTLGW
jgi:hypothetical protein